MASEVVIKKWCDLHLHKSNERVDASFSKIIAVDGLRRRLEACEPCVQTARTLEQWLEIVKTLGTKPVDDGPRAANSWPCLIPDCERANTPYRSASGLRSHMLTRHGSTGVVEPPEPAQDGSLICQLPNCDHPEPFTTTAGFMSHQRRHKTKLTSVPA